MKTKVLKQTQNSTYTLVETIDIPLSFLKEKPNLKNIENVISNYLIDNYGFTEKTYIYYYEDKDENGNPSISVDIWSEGDYNDKYCFDFTKNEDKVTLEIYEYEPNVWEIC